jgi:hypothetical protein
MDEHPLPDDPQRSWEQSYPGTPGQLWHVRSALRQFLAGCPLADDAVLLLSELAANAVQHSDSGKPGGTFTVRARHAADRYVRGEIEDQGSDWHGDLPASAAQPHGLYLLQSLASACGADRTGRAGLVWFRLDYPRIHSGQRRPPAASPAAPNGHISPRHRPEDTTVSTGQPPQPAPHDQADHKLTAVAAGFTAHGITACLSRIADMPVLTIEDPAGGSDPATISVNPDPGTPGLPLQCTCLWTPPPGATPETIAETIIAVLNALRPPPAAHRPGDQDTPP